jgi:palmitoyltransferase
LAGSPQRGVYNWKDNSPPGQIQNQLPQMTAAMSMQQQQQQQQQMSNSLIMGRPPLPMNSQSQNHLQNQNMVIVTSAQQQQQMQQPNVRQSNVSNIINNIVANSANSSGYHPALRGGIQVFPPSTITQQSPQVKRKQTPTRPISFVRALEMANSIEMTNVQQQQQQLPSEQMQQQIELNKSNENPNIQHQQQIADRGSVYDMGVNYEISV